jgi:hypothetical protein
VYTTAASYAMLHSSRCRAAKARGAAGMGRTTGKLMAITERMLIGAIASNPAAYEGAGEYRCCRACLAIYFTSAKQPETTHDGHDTFALPALNPDGSGILVRAFQRYVTGWPDERREQIERFAARKGWDMAMELKYGGGALEDDEAAAWQEIVNERLARLARQARAELEQTAQA